MEDYVVAPIIKIVLRVLAIAFVMIVVAEQFGFVRPHSAPACAVGQGHEGGGSTCLTTPSAKRSVTT